MISGRLAYCGCAFLLSLLVAGNAVRAADVPGGKDPPGLKRYEGSQIIHYVTRRFDKYALARSEGQEWNFGFEKFDTVEGNITRLVYLVPPDPTSLEVFRNYEQMLSAAGFSQTFELARGGIANDGKFLEAFWNQASQGNDGAIVVPGPAPEGYNPKPYYATYHAIQNGQDLSVAIYVIESMGGQWQEPKVKGPVRMAGGQVIATLDVVVAKAIENKMVEVKATDMADALATKGVIDLYGIYFDVDKTDVKPESSKTLDEVASLLKIDRSLKLEISGHTDNTGSTEHNQKLSEGRAQAVVDALVKKYGIDAARLEAKGYGDTKPVASNDNEDGKAKNRRVELRKL